MLKPLPLIVAGLTLSPAVASATAVANITIKQFLANPLAGKVVAPFSVMATPLFPFHRRIEPRSRTHGAAGRIAGGRADTSMKTSHEWLAERMKNEGCGSTTRMPWSACRTSTRCCRRRRRSSFLNCRRRSWARSRDAQALQGDGPGCVQAKAFTMIAI